MLKRVEIQACIPRHEIVSTLLGIYADDNISKYDTLYSTLVWFMPAISVWI